MAEAEHDIEALALWMRHGGDATLRSFGTTQLQGVPREVVDWVARRPAEWRDALRRYVGGPELAEDDVTPGLHVVHGALPVRPTGDRLLPEVRPGATCIDTGAGFGGPLTAAIFTDLQAEPVGFFQAQEDGRCLFVPPRLAPPLGRDPRIALIHADGEPETAADWAIRQDSELLEAKLAAKRRQVRRRQLLATAAGLVLLVGGSAVLLKPALRLVSAPQATRWPLSNEQHGAELARGAEQARGADQARGSDMASLAPQIPAANPQPAPSAPMQGAPVAETSHEMDPGQAKSGQATSGQPDPTQLASSPITQPAPPPQQADAATLSPSAVPEAAPLPEAAPPQVAEAGPQRAHALPPLPEQQPDASAPTSTAESSARGRRRQGGGRCSRGRSVGRSQRAQIG